MTEESLSGYRVNMNLDYGFIGFTGCECWIRMVLCKLIELTPWCICIWAISKFLKKCLELNFNIVEINFIHVTIYDLFLFSVLVWDEKRLLRNFNKKVPKVIFKSWHRHVSVKIIKCSPCKKDFRVKDFFLSNLSLYTSTYEISWVLV